MKKELVKEWSNPFNSFNSWKGMLYQNWYKSIVNWKQFPFHEPIPPVEASLDPIHACNLKCEHCNAHRYLVDETNYYRMTDDHLLRLTKYLGDWGVKAVCYGGGGEPTMHSKLEDALYVCKDSGMEASIATNGTLFTPDLMVAMAMTCRWVGVSIDAATPDTYKIGRKADLFDKAIENLRRLVITVKSIKATKKITCDVAYKFLVFNYNQHEIYDACKLAKSLGVQDFHARPADYSHQGMGDLASKIGGYDVDKVKEQFEKCHELEDDNFHVYTVVHKFDVSLRPRKDFSQCYASPCCIQLCADGGIYLCPDQRFQEEYKIGEHYPRLEGIREAWGSEKHYNLVFKEGKDKCTTRCTFAPYCKQCEELFIKDTDPFCWKFI
jgi:MoaA/NifB/PqqE/SkfB family radical SAM enzyme